ncbi:MAG: ABC transporter ATP-binding protein [Chitinophagales bacterium]|nr:ABC transporter ATP-binding protein [Chitinophagales bacterium]
MLSGKNIYKSYGPIEVLKDVNIDVQKGEVVAIAGPSGSGKSTLLHILGTLDKADEGIIIMNGVELQKLEGKKLAAFRNRHIGFVFQFHHLLPEFSALENVCIPGWLAGRKKKEVEIRAKELLEILGLKERLENKPNQLSGGEQQRVAVARALINNPDIIFADEPTGNLDTANAKELHQLFFDLRKQFNQTFLIVTHNEDLATLSDRVLHMKDGKIV